MPRPSNSNERRSNDEQDLFAFKPSILAPIEPRGPSASVATSRAARCLRKSGRADQQPAIGLGTSSSCTVEKENIEPQSNRSPTGRRFVRQCHRASLSRLGPGHEVAINLHGLVREILNARSREPLFYYDLLCSDGSVIVSAHNAEIEDGLRRLVIVNTGVK